MRPPALAAKVASFMAPNDGSERLPPFHALKDAVR
jgi:hypothetical protein